MISFLLRLFLFSIFIIGLIAFPSMFLPSYWGNKGHAVKMPHVESTRDINTLFVGSSRTQFHIDPIVFDSITGTTKSFNLGYSSTRGEESMFFIEDLLSDKALLRSIDYIFLEVRPLFFDELLYKTLRGKYQLNKDRVMFLQSYFQPINKFATKDLSKAYVESLLGIGTLREEWCQLVVPSLRLTENIAFVGRRGFSNRKQAIENDDMNSKLVKAGEGFVDKLAERKAFAIQCYSSDSVTISTSDSLYISRLTQLYNSLSDQGVQLYFIPTLRFENTNLPSLFNKMPNGYLFSNTSNPLLYPDLYAPEFSGDAAHLNSSGAILYSTILAELFLSINGPL